MTTTKHLQFLVLQAPVFSCHKHIYLSLFKTDKKRCCLCNLKGEALSFNQNDATTNKNSNICTHEMLSISSVLILLRAFHPRETQFPCFYLLCKQCSNYWRDLWNSFSKVSRIWSQRGVSFLSCTTGNLALVTSESVTNYCYKSFTLGICSNCLFSNLQCSWYWNLLGKNWNSLELLCKFIPKPLETIEFHNYYTNIKIETFSECLCEKYIFLRFFFFPENLLIVHKATYADLCRPWRNLFTRS